MVHSFQCVLLWLVGPLLWACDMVDCSGTNLFMSWTVNKWERTEGPASHNFRFMFPQERWMNICHLWYIREMIHPKPTWWANVFSELIGKWGGWSLTMVANTATSPKSAIPSWIMKFSLQWSVCFLYILVPLKIICGLGTQVGNNSIVWLFLGRHEQILFTPSRASVTDWRISSAQV